MSAQQYYTLRWRGEGGRTRESLSASVNPVRIGQTPECDVRLPNPGPYADEQFALILPIPGTGGWKLIPTSDYVRPLVNTQPVELCHFLHDGDHISFSEGDADIVFERREGERFGTETVRYSRLTRRVLLLASTAAALIMFLGFYAFHASSAEQRRNEAALDAADASVFLIQADSIYFEMTVSGVTTRLRRSAASDGEVPMVVSGTAFLTSRGELITARHCIEPWLNYNDTLLYSALPGQLPAGVAWAIEAETHNQLHPSDTTYRVVSRCLVYRGDGSLFGTFLSTDFLYDDSRDEIVELGDYYHQYYLRSITGRFNREDMMLGDWALIGGFEQKGTIHLAPEALLRRKVNPHTALTFKGYPSSRYGMGPETTQGTPRWSYAPGQMIFHSGALSSGFSGGPALVARRGKAWAVGIVSTYEVSGGSENTAAQSQRIFSVPVSEFTDDRP